MNRRAWVVLTVILAGLSVSAWFTKDLIDFHVFHRTAARTLEGSALYREADGDMPFKYAPAIAILIAPLGAIPERPAALLWLVLSAVLLVRFLAYSREQWFPNAPVHAVVIVTALLLPFFRHLLELGQCDLVILALVAESEIQREKRPILSGVLLAIACLFKPPFLLFVALATVGREWRRLIAFGASIAVGAVLPMVRYGVSGNLELLRSWQDTLARTTTPMFCAIDNQSIFGLVCRFIAPAESPLFRPIALLAAALLFALCVVPILLYARRSRPLLLAATFYLSASLSPLGWRTNLLALAPLLFAGLMLGRRVWPLFVAPALNAFIGVLVFDLLGRQTYRALMDLHVYGILALCTAVPILWATARAARSTSGSASPAGS